MTMQRLPDWERRLHDYLVGAAGKLHVYGSHDCALHGANSVFAVTGEDHGAPFRGRYSTERGAVRALRRFGAGTLEATFDAHLPERARAFARRGDLALMDGMIGVVIGGDALFVGREEMGEHAREGLVRFPLARWSKVWGVG